MEKAEPEISNNIDVTLISIKTPIAIPTNVPLKPYNPLLISSLSYPDNEAVKVLTTVPSTDKTASCHELKAIPNNCFYAANVYNVSRKTKQGYLSRK